MIDFGKAFETAFWFDTITRREACPDLSPRILLHAGPPFLGLPPIPVLNAAIQALLFEEIAGNEPEARALISDGGVRFAPAQDHGVATPLAQVVSASMPLAAVGIDSKVTYGALLEGAAPALRFGSASAECRQRLKALKDRMERSLTPRVRRHPVHLAPIIRQAVESGEDCHARTSVANALLVSKIAGLDAAFAADLKGAPAFVLPVLMAAAAAAVRAHRCSIEAIGGNGVDFGVRRRGNGVWQRIRADAPEGNRLTGFESAIPLPAVGDSVLIDFCGLGGHVDHLDLRHALIDRFSGIIDPTRVGVAGLPCLNLGIVAADGAGLIGRGCYSPPAALFREHGTG